MFSESDVNARLEHVGKRVRIFDSWRKGKRGKAIWRQIMVNVAAQINGEFMFLSALCPDKHLYETEDPNKPSNRCSLMQRGELCRILKCPKVQKELNKVQKRYKI